MAFCGWCCAPAKQKSEPDETTPILGCNKNECTSGPVLLDDASHKISFYEALVLFGKGFIGAGWMSTAFGMSEAHLFLGYIMAAGIAIMSAFGMNCLAEVWHSMRNRYEGELTFAILAQQNLGSLGVRILQISLFFGQLGILVCYVIYFGEVGQQLTSGPFWAGALVSLPITVALCQLRNLDRLKDAAFLGTALVLTVIIATTAICFLKVSSDGMGPHVQVFEFATIQPNRFAEFFGIFFFAMEGVTLCIPVIRTMKEPKQSCRLVYLTTCLCTVFYLLVATAGYLAYGILIQAPVFENLPKTMFLNSLRLMQGLSVLLSFPMQAFPLTEMLEPFVPNWPTVLRLLVATVPTFLGILLPHMGPIIGVIGGACMTLLGVGLPCSIYLAHFDSQLPLSGWGGKINCYVVMVVCTILGFWSSAYSAYLLVLQS